MSTEKKGCDKVVGNPFKLKLYPPLINIAEGVYLTKGGNILEYRAKVNALLKLRNNRPLITLALQRVQKSEHKRKKDRPRLWRFMIKFKKILFLFVRNTSQNMEAK
jgi:hypothetical protein